MGVWSSIVKTVRTCKVDGCGVALDNSHRLRLDKNHPNGEPIRRPEGHAAFDHFAQVHPEILAKAMSEMGFEIKSGGPK